MATVTSEALRQRVSDHWQSVVDMLKQKVACAAVSAHGIASDNMRASAQFVSEQLKSLGIDARVIQSTNEDGTPGAFEVVGSRIVDENKPTVLLYAHHDVQPAPNNGEWNTDPFVATEIDGRLYGRGAADDGGGLAIHFGALKALADDLSVNIKVFIEGEEEMGSPSFIPFIESHRGEFDADVIIVADSGNWSDTVPSLTTSLRGNTCVDVTVTVLEHAVHSGQFGGPILDAHTLMARLVASMYDDQGELLVDGLLHEEPIGGLQQDLEEDLVRRDAGVVDGYQLAGSGSLAARLWTKPSVSVIGWDALSVAESFNVIAPQSTIRLSVRTSPRQNPREAQQALSQFLMNHAPFGARVEVTPVEHGQGWAMDPDTNVAHAALDAMSQAFGVEPINKGEGGSIPFIPELQRIFPNAQVLVTGPEDPQSNAHSPNESVSLPALFNNTLAEALFLNALGA